MTKPKPCILSGDHIGGSTLIFWTSWGNISSRGEITTPRQCHRRTASSYTTLMMPSPKLVISRTWNPTPSLRTGRSRTGKIRHRVADKRRRLARSKGRQRNVGRLRQYQHHQYGVTSHLINQVFRLQKYGTLPEGLPKQKKN